MNYHDDKFRKKLCLRGCPEMTSSKKLPNLMPPPTVFFFYVKIELPSVKIFAVALREKAKCAWKNIKKYPWKSQSVRENFEKKTTRENYNYIREKKTKIACVKTKECPWKILEKSLGVPFFAGIFQFCLFFWCLAVFVFLIQNSVRETKKLCVKKFNFVCVKN